MPAELDKNEKTGEAAVAAVGGRESMWHREGVEIPEDAGLDLALERGGLDFEVAKCQTYFMSPPGNPPKSFKAAKDCYVVVRTDRESALGQVGDTYTCLQNKDAFGVLEPMLDAGLARIETCGSLRGGRDVWMLVRFDEGKMLGILQDKSPDDVETAENMLLGPDSDRVVPFGALINNHSGERKVVLKETPVRIVCRNTLDLSLRDSRDLTVQVVHASNVKQNVKSAAELLFGQLALRYGTISQVRKALRDEKLSDEAHERLVLDPVVPTQHLEDKIRRGEATGHTHAALERATRKRREITILWTDGEGHTGDKSAWEAYNGLVQALDHSPSFSTRSDSNRVKSQLRGKLGRVKTRVSRNLIRFQGADEDEREKMLAK